MLEVGIEIEKETEKSIEPIGCWILFFVLDLDVILIGEGRSKSSR